MLNSAEARYKKVTTGLYIGAGILATYGYANPDSQFMWALLIAAPVLAVVAGIREGKLGETTAQREQNERLRAQQRADEQRSQAQEAERRRLEQLRVEQARQEQEKIAAQKAQKAIVSAKKDIRPLNPDDLEDDRIRLSREGRLGWGGTLWEREEQRQQEFLDPNAGVIRRANPFG